MKVAHRTTDLLTRQASQDPWFQSHHFLHPTPPSTRLFHAISTMNLSRIVSTRVPSQLAPPPPMQIDLHFFNNAINNASLHNHPSAPPPYKWSQLHGSLFSHNLLNTTPSIQQQPPTSPWLPVLPRPNVLPLASRAVLPNRQLRRPTPTSFLLQDLGYGLIYQVPQLFRV